MELTDLFQVVDQYDEQVFVACRETLYESLGFKVLPIAEIRRVDLKEKLADFFCYNETGKKSNGSFEKPFASFVQRAIGEHFVFNSEREKKYHSLVETYIASINKGTADLSTIENLVLVYISDFCVYKGYFQDKKREGRLQVTDITYYLDRDDVDVAKYVFDEITICHRYTQRKGIKRKEETVIERFSESERLFAYVISVLFIYRILQYEGEL